MAPLFEVLESPNDWDRRIEQLATTARESSPDGSRRRRFWDRYRRKYPDVATDIGAGGGSSIWHDLPGSDYVVSQYVSNESVGVFVRGRRGIPMASVVEGLAPHREALEAVLGAKLDDREFPLISRRRGDVESDGDFETQASWLHERLLVYKTELTKVLGSET